MDTPDFEHGRVYFKQFGAERVKEFDTIDVCIVIQGFGGKGGPKSDIQTKIEKKK